MTEQFCYTSPAEQKSLLGQYLILSFHRKIQLLSPKQKKFIIAGIFVHCVCSVLLLVSIKVFILQDFNQQHIKFFHDAQKCSIKFQPKLSISLHIKSEKTCSRKSLSTYVLKSIFTSFALTSAVFALLSNYPYGTHSQVEASHIRCFN